MKKKQLFSNLKKEGLYFCDCKEDKKRKKVIKKISDTIANSTMNPEDFYDNKQLATRDGIALSVAAVILNPFFIFSYNEYKDRILTRDFILNSTHLLSKAEHEYFKNNLSLLGDLIHYKCFGDDSEL